MPSIDATIVLIDDDADVRVAVSRLLRSAGWATRDYHSAEAFLSENPRFDLGCILLDVSMPQMTGPELHQRLARNGIALPVIYLSARCTVPMSVQAMKSGAVDVLEKPADDEILLRAVEQAVCRHRQANQHELAVQQGRDRFASLSRREREVMEHVILGRLNKQIAADLGIALKTVKVHRGRMLAKIGVRSVAELVHLYDLVSGA